MAAQSPTANSLKSGRWVRSTCKMCLHSCSTIVHVTDDGVINKIEGDPTNPSNNGKLCPKGNSGIMRHYDPQRFKQPMRRTNPKKGPGVDPMWEPISWDEALDITAREIKKSLDEGGPQRIFPSIEDFQKMNIWNWPMAIGCTNFFQSGGTMCGGGYHPLNGYIHSTFGAVNDAKYCNYWISNGAGDGFSSHLHAAAASNWVAKARVERGMKVVAVEPRMSIAAAKAEEWVPIRPATDRHFAMSMAHVMVEEGLCDYEFLRKDTNAPYLVGPDQMFVRNSDGDIYVWDSAANCAKLWNGDFKNEDLALEGEYEVEGVKCRPAFQVYKDILADSSPEAMEKVTTVPPETVRRIARDFAKAASIGSTIQVEDGRTLPLRPAAYNYYRGAQGRKKGMQANQSFQLVNMLIGNIDHPGGRIGVTLTDGNVNNNHCFPGECGQMLGVPHQLGHMPPFAWPPREYHLGGMFPVGVHPPHLNMLSYLEPEKWGVTVKPDVMVNCHSNPVWSIQGPRDKWLEIIEGLRFIVCVDIIPTEMTDFADIILPSHDYLESYNATMIEPPYTEGICFRQPITEPLYDTKCEEDIFNEISERLGVLDQYNEAINLVLGFGQREDLKLQPGIKYGEKEIAERVGKLWNDKPIEWYMEHGHSSTERRLDKKYRPWEGMRLLFYIEDLVKEREALKAKFKECNVPDEIYNLWPFSDYQPLPTTELDPIHLEPKEYDLYGITFKDIQMNFGESLSNPWIKDITYRDPVHSGLLLNVHTAKKKGLADGDIVRVDSPHGTIYGRLKTTEAVHHETLGISNALSRTKTENRSTLVAGGHYNDLLPYDMTNTDGATGQPETSCRVKLTKLDDWPDFLKKGLSVYDFINELENKRGKGRHH